VCVCLRFVKRSQCCAIKELGLLLLLLLLLDYYYYYEQGLPNGGRVRLTKQLVESCIITFEKKKLNE